MYINRYKNRPHMTFEDVNIRPEQEFELITDLYGVHEYPVRYKCSNFIYILIYKMYFYNCNYEQSTYEILKLYTRFNNYKFCYRTVKFSSVQHLSLYFVGERVEQIEISYIGLKGEWTPAHKHGVTICTYEARPLISDHPTDLSEINRMITD